MVQELLEGNVDLKNYFDRVVLINLDRRPDRLWAFNEQLKEKGWPFKEPERIRGCDGDRVPKPVNWNHGNGTYGCLRSHNRVLEDAILDGVSSILVLEDDAQLCDNFTAEVQKFLENVPSDWEGLMLGGQHMNISNDPPVPVSPGVVRCVNCQRTHAYAVRGHYMEDLYKAWVTRWGHCDHIMGPMHRNYKVYAPDPLLIAQAAGKSDISGREDTVRSWNPPAHDMPVLLLTDVPWNSVGKQQIASLRRKGCHFGHSRATGSDIDNGLIDMLSGKKSEPDVESAFRKWVDMLSWETAAISNGQLVIWHPAAASYEPIFRKVVGDRLKLVTLKDLQ